MEFSKGEEELGLQSTLAATLTSRVKEEAATQLTLMPSIFRNITPGAPYPNTFCDRIDCMRRSAFGEVYSYKEIRQIGSGGFGNCFLLERKTDKALRVVKVQARDFYDDDGGENAPYEVHILRDILPQHDRILRLHDFVVQSHTVQLYYDYYNGGDLQKLIRRYYDQYEDIPETFLWHAYLQISEAIAFLHYGYDRRQLCSPPANWTSVIHGDIKDKNIFLGPPDPFSKDPLAREYPSLILGDFGMADIEPTYRLGTPKWQPPELPITSMKADVWGVGGVLHALAHEGKPPIAPLPLGFTWEEWCENPSSRDPTPLHGLYSDELHDCVSNALAILPNKRYNSYELYSKVLSTWCSSIAPFCDDITPLIPDRACKRYDANGVTLNTKSYKTEQSMAPTAAMEVRISFEDTGHNAGHPSNTLAKKRPHSEIASKGQSITFSEAQRILKKAKCNVIFSADAILTVNDSMTQSTLLDPYSMDFITRRNWISPEEYTILEMQDSRSRLSPLLPFAPAADGEGRCYLDCLTVERAIDDIELQAVAVVIYHEVLTFDHGRLSNDQDNLSNTNAFTIASSQADQLHAAIASTLGGIDFDIDPSDWFIEAGKEAYIFGATCDTERGADPMGGILS